MRSATRAILALVLIGAAACAGPIGPSASIGTPAGASCFTVAGEEVHGFDWSLDGTSLAVLTQETARPMAERRDVIRRLDVRLGSWTDIVATRDYVAGAAVGADGRVYWYQTEHPGFAGSGNIWAAEDSSSAEIVAAVDDDVVVLTWTTEGLVHGSFSGAGDTRLELVLDRGTAEADDVIFEADHPIAQIWVSPDAEWIVTQENLERPVARFVAHHNGGEVVLDGTPDFAQLWGMTADRSAIVYTRLSETLEFVGVFLQPLDGTEASQLSLPADTGTVGVFEIAPDGQMAWAGLAGPAKERICVAESSLWGL